jgi:hypothetical protein
MNCENCNSPLKKEYFTLVVTKPHIVYTFAYCKMSCFAMDWNVTRSESI